MRKIFCVLTLMLTLFLFLLPAGGAANTSGESTAETETEEIADEEVPLAEHASNNSFFGVAVLFAAVLAGGSIMLTTASGRAIAADGFSCEDFRSDGFPRGQ